MLVGGVLKPFMAFRPARIPVGPAVAGMVVAGAMGGLTALATRRFAVGQGWPEQSRRFLAAGILALEAYALVGFKPVSKIVGEGGVPAALLLTAGAVNHVIGALRPQAPVPSLTAMTQNSVLRVLGGGVGSAGSPEGIAASHETLFRSGRRAGVRGTASASGV